MTNSIITKGIYRNQSFSKVKTAQVGRENIRKVPRKTVIRNIRKKYIMYMKKL